MSDRLHRRNRTVMVSLFGLVFGMVGASFAAVPLYDLFCRVTGYGGTTQVAEGYSTEILDREMQVRFVARADADLPWQFTSETGRMTVRVGEPNLAYYRVENTSDQPVTGMAVYNVSPFEVGAYFQKMECFCFGNQTLQPGETMELPVYFYIDAAIADERTLSDVTSVTLSYTFYPTESDELDDAVEGYYQSVEQTASATAPEPQTKTVSGLNGI